MRAGRELGFPVKEAESALKRQTVNGIVGWNDAAERTHAEVVAAFDAAWVGEGLSPYPMRAQQSGRQARV